MVDGMIQAHCNEHRAVGLAQKPDPQGWNAVGTEARGHDDTFHDVYRFETGWREAIGAKNAR